MQSHPSTFAFVSAIGAPFVTPKTRALQSKHSARKHVRTFRRANIVATQTPPEMPEEAKKAVAAGDNVGYWQGEWICVDCGFVYKPTRRVKFEDLPGSWKCPQCNAPKRRFAKKAGDYIAETAGTSNLPIIVFSIVGLIATIAFGFWASANL